MKSISDLSIGVDVPLQGGLVMSRYFYQERPCGIIAIPRLCFSFSMFIPRIEGIYCLNDDMTICAAIAKRRNTSPSKSRVAWPRCCFRVDFDVPSFLIDCSTCQYYSIMMFVLARNLLAGLMVLSPATPGIVAASVIIAAFMTANMPLAASLWPMFALICLKR